MSDKIVIKIDLDNEEYKKSLKETQEASEMTSKKIGQTLDKNISVVLERSVKKSVEDTTSAIERLTSTIASLTAKAALITPIFIFLERQFGVFTKFFRTFGIDLDKVIDRVKFLSETFNEFLDGESGIQDMKIAIGLLLQELGILNKFSLKVVDTFFKFTELAPKLAGIGAVVAALVKPTALLARNIKEVTQFTVGLTSIFFKPGGLFSATFALGAISASFATLGAALQDSENKVVNLTGRMALLASVITGSLAGAISFIIIEAGQLFNRVGTDLVKFFDTQSKNFSKFERDVQVFNATVAAVNRNTENAAGSLVMWTGVIERLGNQFNVATSSVRKAAQEILLVGPKIGLTEQQMRKLLVVSTEYAKINKKDVFETTVAIINALNGNSQAVAALGIKLSAAAVQQSIFKKGQDRVLASLSDTEKVGERYNKLMSEYAGVMGIGQVAATSLAEQNEALERNIQRVNTALGEGARIIENNGLLAFVYNRILNRLSDTVFKVAGVLGAFGARVLQIGGFLLEFSFKIFAVYKIYRILDALFVSGVGIKLFARQIPFINTSLNQMLGLLTGTAVRVTTLKELFSALALAMRVQLNQASLLFFRTSLKNLTVLNALTGGFKALRLAILRTYVVLAPLLIPLIKIAAIVAIIVAPFIALYKAIQELEARTKVFSEAWAILKDELNDSDSLLSKFIQFFVDAGKAVKDVANKAFGIFVFGLAKVVQAITALANRNPFGAFSADTLVRIRGLNRRLGDFSANLKQVGFDLSKLNKQFRKPAGSDLNLDKINESLAKIRLSFKEAGEDSVKSLAKNNQEALKVLEIGLANQLLKRQEYNQLVRYVNDQFAQGSLEQLGEITGNTEMAIRDSQNRMLDDLVNYWTQGIITEQQYLMLKKQINEQAAKDIEKINKNQFQNTVRNFNRLINSAIVNIVAEGLSRLGGQLINGKKAWQDWEKAVLGIVGDLAINLGKALIAKGTAIEALEKSLKTLSGGAAIAAGAALIALGGSLKAAATGDSSASTPTSTGGGLVSGAEPGGGIIQDTQDTRREPDTNLVVNIQGDILDGQETGRRMVDVINDAFGKQGVVLRDVRQA